MKRPLIDCIAALVGLAGCATTASPPAPTAATSTTPAKPAAPATAAAPTTATKPTATVPTTSTNPPSPTTSAPTRPLAAASASASGDYGPVQKVRSRNGKTEGEIIGTVVIGGKFSKLQIGMPMNEVLALIGGPDAMDSHETGKRWIPFYFGNDARRVEVLYKGEGCLTYTGGNAWGGGDNELIRITATSRVDCLE